MMQKLLLPALLLGLAATNAAANQSLPTSTLDIYMMPKSELDIEVSGMGSASDTGDGLGFKGEIGVENMFLSGEYQTTDYDLSGSTIEYLRLGLGAQSSGTLSFGGVFELVRFDLDGTSASGVGFHGRIGVRLAERVQLKAQAGYVGVTDAAEVNYEGPEYSVGIAAMALPNLGIFADIRNSKLEDEFGIITMDISDVRVGARLAF